MSEKPKYTDIYLIRHGIPDYEHDNLTPDGHIEAEQASVYLSTIPFDFIFASSQGRAVATAQPTAKKLGIPIVQLDWAREDTAWSYMAVDKGNGQYTWCFFLDQYLEKLYELKNNPKWFEDEYFKNTKFKEGMKFYEEEVDKWLLSLNLKHDRNKGIYHKIGDTPSNVALFAHGGMANEVIPSIADINYPVYVRAFAHLHTCAFCLIRIWHEGRAEIHKYNVKASNVNVEFNEMNK